MERLIFQYYLNHWQLIKGSLCSLVGQEGWHMLLISHISHSEFLIHIVSQKILLLISCFRNVSYDKRQDLYSYFNVEHKISTEYEQKILNVFLCIAVCLNIYVSAILVRSEALPQAFLNPHSFSLNIRKYISLSSEMAFFSCVAIFTSLHRRNTKWNRLQRFPKQPGRKKIK